MWQFLRVVTTLAIITEVLSLSCLEVKKGYEKTCLQSEHDNYVQCVKGRMKRHPHECDYDDECYACDCESCSYSQCGGECEDCCNACCSNYVQCHTNHCCHRQCHSECRTYNCRSSCRKACYGTVEQEKHIGTIYERVIPTGYGESSSSQDVKVNNTNVHNITTIINLKNVLNNTNFLDVPINLTYTNKNNITLRSARPSMDETTEDNCCIIIGPKQCVPIQISPYVRCFHTRSRQCGQFCSANIVHEESKQVCNSVDEFGRPTNCQQQTSYIPQPQPVCTYTSTWPYVSCKIQPPAACEGCYGHYFNPEVQKFKSCPPQCYDDFSIGPLYRQGPIYQPGYSHIPPCAYSPQGCPGSFGGIRGYGEFGVGMNGIGLRPGFPMYEQFPGVYGQGINQGYGPGYAPNPYEFPVQEGLPWNPSFFRNTTSPISNATILGNTGTFQPTVINGYQNDMGFIPLNNVPGKEVEIDVSITKSSGAHTQKSKRRATKNPTKTENISVITV